MMLSGDLLAAARQDAILFSFQVAALLFIARKRHKGIQFIFLLIYGTVTFSAYNFYIKTIHDYNIPILRTMLFKFQVFGPLYLIDVALFLGLAISLVAITVRRRGSFQISLPHGSWAGTLLLRRDILLFTFSIIGFFLYQFGGEQTSAAPQFRVVRGILLGAFFLWLLFAVKRQIVTTVAARKIVASMAMIDAINIAGEIVASQIFSNYVWQRGGHEVVLIDQANYMLAMLYLPLILWPRFAGVKISIFGFLLSLLMIFNYVKSFMLGAPIFFLIYGVVAIASKRKLSVRYVVATALMLAAAPYLLTLIEGKAIAGTRGTQLESYLEHTSDNWSAVIIGTGAGGMYPVYDETDDGGEIKESDLDSANAFQVEFQVPFLVYYKWAGVIGLLIVLATAARLLIAAVHCYSRSKMLAAHIIILIVGSLFFAPPFLNADPNLVIYYSRLFFMIILLQATLASQERRKDVAAF